MRTFSDDFEMLLTGFERYVEMARILESPNQEDDVFVRAAIVGFSFNQPTESWTREHFEFHRKRAPLPTEPGFEYENDNDFGSIGTRLFSSLAIGFLLGLYQGASIDDAGFALAEAQLAGFVAANLERINLIGASES
jgi:hypothetical protein